VLAAIYFVSFIGLGTMIMLNLFTGVIINSMEEASNEAAESKRRKNLETRGHVTIGDELGEVGRKLQELAGQIEVLTRNNAEALNRNAAGGAGNGRAGAPIAIDTGKLA
jgi:voltage-gated sodium channel